MSRACRLTYTVVLAVMAAACGVHGGDGGALVAEPTTVSVAPDELVIWFPAVARTSWSCSYRGYAPDDRLYRWIVQIGGGNPWRSIEVSAAIPDSIRDSGRSLSPILAHASAGAYRVGGEPPMILARLDSTVSYYAVDDTALVMRVDDRRTIRRLFGTRPRTVRVYACVDGEDSFMREVPVEYAPGF